MKKLFLMLLLAATLEARPIAITNVNVISMTNDKVARDQVVIVDGDTIVNVGKNGEVPIPAGAQQIDGEGGYIVPGLIDLHVHVSMPDDLALYVANGVTTVFNLNGDRGSLEFRRASFAPRFFTTGEAIVGVKSVERAHEVVANDAKLGFDGIKIYDDITLDALQTLIDDAHAHGLLAVGHIPRNLRWQDMLAAKPDAIAHAEEFLYSPVDDGDDERIVAQMKEGGISLITTLVTYDTIGRQVADLESLLARGENVYVNPSIRRMWDRERNRYVLRFPPKRVANLRRLLAFQKSLVKELNDGSVRILLGTDAGGVPFVVPGFSAIDELRELVSSGLTPYAAMRAATIDAAHFLKHDDFGTIEAGKRADFILLRGNPLSDIDNIALRAGVMLRGRWLDNAALHAELDRIARVNRAEEPVVRAIGRGATSRPVRESTLNELAYQLWKVDNNLTDAVKLFRTNAKLHPKSWQARESLDEALNAARSQRSKRRLPAASNQ